MGDISAFHFPYHNISVPNGIPFYPIISQSTNQDGQTNYKVKFVQGYVIDLTTQIPSIIKVDKCDGDGSDGGWPVSSKSKFYVKVVYKTATQQDETPTDKSVIKSAEVAPIPDGEGEALKETDKIYLICEFTDQSLLSKTVLRQNIIVGGKTFWVLNEKGEPQKYNIPAHPLSIYE
jgi:hypothetical protein